MAYNNWNLDQHPSAMIEQMEKQIKEGQSFISTFIWQKCSWESKKSFISLNVKCKDGGESLWIFKKNKKTVKIKMWDGHDIIDPRPFLDFSKKETFNQKIKRLEIERRAYSGSEKLKKVEAEIEQIEKDKEMALDELISNIQG